MRSDEPLFDRRWPATTLTVLVHLELDEVTGHELADWALDALEAGLDSPALRRLAGSWSESGVRRADAEPLFRVAAREVGLPTLSREEVLLAYMDEFAQAIATGAADLDDILHAIHESVIEPLNHPEILMPWCYAHDRLQMEAHEPLDDDGVRALARKWLEDRQKA